MFRLKNELFWDYYKIKLNEQIVMKFTTFNAVTTFIAISSILFKIVKYLCTVYFDVFLSFVRYCKWLKNQRKNFLPLPLFIDKATFSRSGVLNLHVLRNHQYRFSINVWADIIDSSIKTNKLYWFFCLNRMNRIFYW